MNLCSDYLNRNWKRAGRRKIRKNGDKITEVRDFFDCENKKTFSEI